MSVFIDKSKLAPASEKSNDLWFLKWSKQFYFSGGRNLLEGKDVNSIDRFAAGDHPMSEYRKMYKASVKQQASSLKLDGLSEDEQVEFRNNYIKVGTQDDLAGIDFSPIGLLVQPLNSAIASISKMPVEIKATAIDAIAADNRKHDKDIIKNRQKMAEALSDVAGKTNEESFDIGGMEHNVYGDEFPLGIDLSTNQGLGIGMELFYKMRPESAFETLLEQWAYVKHIDEVKHLEIVDHFRYGVSCHKSFVSDTTGMPDIPLYTSPKNIWVSRGSKMPDASDSEFVRESLSLTVSEFYNSIGEEIGTVEELHKIVTEWAGSPHGGNGCAVPSYTDEGFMDFRFHPVYTEWKAIDMISIGTVINPDGSISKKNFPEDYQPADGVKLSKRFAENTYCCYWIPGTEHVFKCKKLTGFERKKGQEYFSPFSYNIRRSQERSAVELCISEVKIAQKAYIKLQHCIIRSKPPGVYIDIKFLKQAMEGLANTGGYDMASLLNLFFNHNIMIGDSTDTNANEANMMPFHVIPGGIGKEVEGYWNTIAMAAQTIGRITGINDQLTGQSANPEGLVGLQKLLVNASINSLNYVVVAIKNQYLRLFNHWATLFLSILKDGDPAAKKAIEEMITYRKVELLKDVSTIYVHQYSIRIELAQHEEQKAIMRESIQLSIQAGTMSSAEGALLLMIDNPKDQLMLLMIMDKNHKEEQRQQQQAQLLAMQQNTQMQVQGKMQQEQLKGQNQVAVVEAEAKTDAYLMELANKMGMSVEYVKNLYKQQQANQRIQGQITKTLATQNNQAAIDAQKAFA